jgi:hypothetical protein
MVAWSSQLLFCVDSAGKNPRFVDPGLVCFYANWWQHRIVSTMRAHVLLMQFVFIHIDGDNML